MEGIEQLKFSQQLIQTLNNSALADENLDMVTLHCRRDHLCSSSFHQNKSSSCYNSSYTSNRNPTSYNQTAIEKGLQQFREYENSTTLLPSIPRISEHSHYQKSYHGHSQEKPEKSKEKQSYFLKHNWALDPTSNYQKDYLSRDSSEINKFNNQRPDYNNLTVFKLKQKPELSSNYRTNFKALTIKKQAELSIGNKDHLKSNTRGLFNNEAGSISEYQKRYDSVMELTKNKENKLSIYNKNVISRRPKHP